MKKPNLILPILIAAPTCAFALYISGVSLYLGIAEAQGREALGGIASSVGFGWAAYTGIRNLLRFDRAHLHLKWYDWVGGVLGCIANVFLLAVMVSLMPLLPNAGGNWYIIAGLTALFLSSVCSLVCFWVVAVRFWKNRKAKQ